MTRRCIMPPVGAAQPASTAHRAVIPSYQTERLTLRAPMMSDFPAWRTLMVPDTEGYLGGPHTEEEAWEAFCVYVAGWLLHGHGLWSVELREGGALAGFVHLGLEWGDAEPELGWMFLPEHRGLGYAREAAEQARAHGATLFGASGFVSYVDPDNAPSNRLAQHLGGERDASAEASIDDGQTHVWRYGGHA